MQYSTIVYIISVSFQITGALILIIKCLSTKRRNVVKRFFLNSFSIYSPDSNILNYNHELFEEEYEKAYYNKISFFSLFIGYIFSPFSDIGSFPRLYVALFILLLTLILLSAFIFICTLLRKKGHSKVTMNELINVGIDENLPEMSKEDIDEIFKDFE